MFYIVHFLFTFVYIFFSIEWRFYIGLFLNFHAEERRYLRLSRPDWSRDILQTSVNTLLKRISISDSWKFCFFAQVYESCSKAFYWDDGTTGCHFRIISCWIEDIPITWGIIASHERILVEWHDVFLLESLSVTLIRYISYF